jgi:CelD/BcsL family acetyltransferase involved in cellulose biosynthesis
MPELERLASETLECTSGAQRELGRRMVAPSNLSPLAHTSPASDGANLDAQSSRMMPPLILLDVPHLNEWAPQWDQLVDSSPLPSPFLRSWWLAGTSQSGRHFLLVVDDAQLVGGLALEERHHTSSIRMMGSGSASDHLDLLAAPGHEEAVLSLLRDWFRRPGWRLLDLNGVHSESRLVEVLPGRVRRETMAVAPFAMLPESAEAYRSTLSSQFRRNLRRSADRLRAEGLTQQTVRGSGVVASLDTLRILHYLQWGDRSNFLPVFDRFVAGCAGGAVVDEVVVHELVSEDSVVASVMAFEVAGRVSLYQSARQADPRWRDATTVLLATIIDDACDRGFREVDFLRGEEAYKGRFAPNRREVIRLIAGKGIVGQLGRIAVTANARAKRTAVWTVHLWRSLTARLRN